MELINGEVVYTTQEIASELKITKSALEKRLVNNSIIEWNKAKRKFQLTEKYREFGYYIIQYIEKLDMQDKTYVILVWTESGRRLVLNEA